MWKTESDGWVAGEIDSPDARAWVVEIVERTTRYLTVFARNPGDAVREVEMLGNGHTNQVPVSDCEWGVEMADWDVPCAPENEARIRAAAHDAAEAAARAAAATLRVDELTPEMLRALGYESVPPMPESLRGLNFVETAMRAMQAGPPPSIPVRDGDDPAGPPLLAAGSESSGARTDEDVRGDEDASDGDVYDPYAAPKHLFLVVIEHAGEDEVPVYAVDEIEAAQIAEDMDYSEFDPSTMRDLAYWRVTRVQRCGEGGDDE